MGAQRARRLVAPLPAPPNRELLRRACLLCVRLLLRSSRDRLLREGVSGSASVERACCAGVAPTPSLSPGVPAAPEPVPSPSLSPGAPAAPGVAPSPSFSLGVLAVLEGRSAWGPSKGAAALWGRGGVSDVRPLLDALAVLDPISSGSFLIRRACGIGGAAWDPSKGATALWESRILFPLGVPAAPGAPPSLSPWACLLRRNPFRALPLPGRACCMRLRLASAALCPQSWDCLWRRAVFRACRSAWYSPTGSRGSRPPAAFSLLLLLSEASGLVFRPCVCSRACAAGSRLAALRCFT